MPWTVVRSSSCPDSRPWAVVRDADGEVEGCHASEEAAKQQMAALYAQDSIDPTGKNMHHKAFDIIETKADADAGTFEATVAVFNNVDRGGDRIMPGAFTKTLAQWEASGDPIPVILSHQWDNPMAHIGVAYAKDIAQTDKGLLVKGTLDVSDNDVARQVHRLMSRRSLKEFSFGYAVPKGGEKRAKDGANELSDLELFEVGPTLKGMNPATELHSVKKALDVEEPVPTPDQETLRKQSQEIERDLIKRDLPEPAEESPPVTVAEVLEQMLAFQENVKAVQQRQLDVFAAFAGVKELPDDLKESLSDQERQILEAAKKAEETDKEPKKTRSVDPLRRESQQAVLDAHTRGVSLSKPPEADPEPDGDEVDLKGLRRESRLAMLKTLTGAIHENDKG